MSHQKNKPHSHYRTSTSTSRSMEDTLSSERFSNGRQRGRFHHSREDQSHYDYDNRSSNYRKYDYDDRSSNYRNGGRGGGEYPSHSQNHFRSSRGDYARNDHMIHRGGGGYYRSHNQDRSSYSHQTGAYNQGYHQSYSNHRYGDRNHYSDQYHDSGSLSTPYQFQGAGRGKLNSHTYFNNDS